MIWRQGWLIKKETELKYLENFQPTIFKEIETMFIREHKGLWPNLGEIGIDQHLNRN